MSKDPDIKARNEARNVELKEHLYHLAKNAEREETQLSAAVAWLDRDEGKPIARQINAAVDSPEKLLRIEIVDEPGANTAAGSPPAAPAARIEY